MQYVYLGLFVIATVVHLVGCIKGSKYYRDVSKGFILFSILGFYLEAAPQRSWFVILALLCGFVGDYLMIPYNMKWFPLGGTAFLGCNVFLIIEFLTTFDITKTNIFVIIVPLVFFISAVIIVYTLIKKSLKTPLLLSSLGYLTVNGIMNTLAICKLFAIPTLGSALTAVGALLFFVSDTALFLHRFKPNSIQKSQFFVMLTYALGEFLIVLGFVI